MLRQFRPELGEQQRKNSILAVYRPYSKKFKLYTNIILTGKGCTCDDETGKNNYLGLKSYIVTQKYFEKICKEFEVDQELLFD